MSVARNRRKARNGPSTNHHHVLPTGNAAWEWGLLVVVLGLRLISMALLPLTDTTEARYGEIARLMSVTGDWITPWFSPGVPFWGKPPLSFWCEALSYNVLGVSEFAARLPSWLATIATLMPIFALAHACYGARAARRALLIFSTCALVYVLSGAVLTDPFLVLGTTWSMAAFLLAPTQPKVVWRYGFFLGLAIGLLAKGPITLVLVGGAVGPWLLWNHRHARTHLAALPWLRGSLILGALVLPWYIAADIKTPGFLYYFIVGEHFLRYLDPGWAGDLYGTAHQHAYGTIWWYWLVTAAPWSLLALGILVVRLAQPDGRFRLRLALTDPVVAYLLAWSLFTLVFFSVSANILWTYVLPALPAFSILLASRFEHGRQAAGHGSWRTPVWMTSITPLIGIAITIVALAQPQRLKTAESLVQYVEDHAQHGAQLVYVGSRPFSARFYSREKAGLVSLQRLPGVVAEHSAQLYLAVPRGMVADVAADLDLSLTTRFHNSRYVLVTPDTRPVTAATGHSGTPSKSVDDG